MLLSVDVSNIESPDCNLSARPIGPQAAQEMVDLIQSSVTIEISYTGKQNTQGTFQVEIKSNGKIVAQDGLCEAISESLSEEPVSF